MALWFKSLCISNLIFVHVRGGYPISHPQTGETVPYNIIDTDPSCFHEGICPMFPPGGELSAFPNSEEKFQHILHNMHRMFPNQSLDIAEGKWKYGANKNGGRTVYCQHSCEYCGTWHDDRRPLYWYSDANQMARFKQWDENQCDQEWYKEPGNTAHSTCRWGWAPISTWGSGNDSITGSNRCSLFGTISNPAGINETDPAPFNDDCAFGGRSGKFCHDEKDECEFHAEGICGGNSCFWDPHCEVIFANMYDYVGKGFVAGMNGVAAVYSRYTKETDYLLVMGSHYDERLKLVHEDWDKNGKTFALMLQYWDDYKQQKVTDCYALFDDQYVSMNVYVSNSPNDRGKYKGNGFYDKNSFSVLFKQNYNPPTQCMPYSFLCKTSKNEFVRLPEDSDYYFGTEWIDWSWSDYKGLGYDCKENHYFYDGNEWIVNGGPTLKKTDIWYYRDANAQCIGCSKIYILDCWTNCILSDFDQNQCQCSPTTTTTAAPTQPTDAPSMVPTGPTKSPTPRVLTHRPTNTLAPTESTQMPTLLPSISPTNMPTMATFTPTLQPVAFTNEPTISPSQMPSLSPSELPTSLPTMPPTMPTKVQSFFPTTNTVNPTLQPIVLSKEPTMSPSDTPSFFPSVLPTKQETTSPTQMPSDHPTFTLNPTFNPTFNPTLQPIVISTEPTITPTKVPSSQPSISPVISNYSMHPSTSHIKSPTLSPTLYPTFMPSESPIDSSADTVESVWSYESAKQYMVWILLFLFILCSLCAVCAVISFKKWRKIKEVSPKDDSAQPLSPKGPISGGKNTKKLAKQIQMSFPVGSTHMQLSKHSTDSVPSGHNRTSSIEESESLDNVTGAGALGLPGFPGKGRLPVRSFSVDGQNTAELKKEFRYTQQKTESLSPLGSSGSDVSTDVFDL